MARWKDKFDAHPVHQTLIEIKTLLREDHSTQLQGESSEKRRLLKVIELCERALARVDPEILPDDLLNALNRSLEDDGILEKIQAFKSDGELNFLSSVNDIVSDIVLPHLVQLRSIARITGKEIPLRHLEEFSDKTISGINSQTKHWQTQLNGLNQQYQDLEDIMSSMSTKITTEDKRLNRIIEDFSQKFTDDQDKRIECYTSWLGDHKLAVEKQSQDMIESLDKGFKETSDQTLNNIGQAYEAAEEIHQDIKALYELAAGDSVGGGYAQTAMREKQIAKYWNFGALAFILLAAVSGYQNFTAVGACGAGCNYWLLITSSTSMTLILLIGATFCARRAKMHHNAERAAKWLSLEVKAIDPFIASLDQKDRTALKIRLAERLFGQQSAQNSQNINKAMIEDSIFRIIGRECLNVFKKSSSGE